MVTFSLPTDETCAGIKFNNTNSTKIIKKNLRSLFEKNPKS